jgi:hypothetical protein
LDYVLELTVDSPATTPAAFSERPMQVAILTLSVGLLN